MQFEKNNICDEKEIGGATSSQLHPILMHPQIDPRTSWAGTWIVLISLSFFLHH